jgi:histidinol-phosphatase (PHP family)
MKKGRIHSCVGGKLPDIKPLNCGPVSDYHIHPDYSVDGEGTLEDWCRAAFNIGLSEICFTPHYEANPARKAEDAFMKINNRLVELSDEAIRTYLEHADQVAKEYGLIGLMVRAGLEFGYFPGWEKEVSELKSRHNIHFSLGGVHSFDDLCFTCHEDAPKLFAKLTLDQLADRYFEMLDRMASSGSVDALAHMDIYRRFGLGYYGKGINTIHRGRIEKLFKTMLAHDVGYELNTSAIRHGQHEYYPCMEIVNMAREAGVRLISLGSDAHRPEDIALDFEAAAAVAYELFPYVDE